MFSQYTDIAIQLAQSGKSKEAIIAELKARGASQMQTVAALKKAFQLSLKEADQLVLNAKAWEEKRPSTISLRTRFFSALENLNPEKEKKLFNILLKGFPEEQSNFSYQEFSKILKRVEQEGCGIYDIAIYRNESLKKVLTFESYCQSPDNPWYWEVLQQYAGDHSIRFAANFHIP